MVPKGQIDLVCNVDLAYDSKGHVYGHFDQVL